MKRTIYFTLATSFVLASCNQKGWTEENKKEFVGNCKSSFISSFESTMGENMHMVDKEELKKVADRYCNCSYETIEKKYKSPEEAFSKPIDRLLEEAEGCEPTEKEASKLLK